MKKYCVENFEQIASRLPIVELSESIMPDYITRFYSANFQCIP